MLRFNRIIPVLMGIFFFILSCSFSYGKEPLYYKGIILKNNKPYVTIKQRDEKQVSFILYDKTLFVKNNFRCDFVDFKTGEEVYCYSSEDSKKLLALVDVISAETISSNMGANYSWLLALENAFYGQKCTVRGTLKKISEKNNILILLTEDGKKEELHLMKDIVIFDREKNFTLSDFSWKKFVPETSVEAIGYRKNERLLDVFYIELGKFKNTNSSAAEFDLFKGVVSQVNKEKKIVEVKNKDGKKAGFQITADTIVFDWETGEEADFDSLASGQEVKIESIFSINSTNEAVIIEIGDPELYN